MSSCRTKADRSGGIMNKNREKNLWNFRYKIVSGLMTAMLVFAGLAVLLPMSSRVAEGYSMPINVDWDMDDLVTNSSGAVTMGTPDLYYVHEDVYISLNSTLVVSPGEKVYFDLGTGFNVYGYLTATGNNVSMITFTSSESSPSYGDWDGISFYNGSGGTIQYVIVSYAETGILANNTMLSPIWNCEFEYNVWGVHIINAYCSISFSTFKFNGILPHPDPYHSVGGGLYVENYTYGSVSHNDFISNIGGVRVEGSSYLYIMNNNFYNNTVYGVFCLSDIYRQTYTNIFNNEITYNQYYGIYVEGSYEIFIDSNNITNNNVGIRIGGTPGTTGGWGSIYNNYIAYNLENGIECIGSWKPGYPDPGSPYISGNEIISNGIAGVYCEDSSPTINSNEFIGNQFGVYALNSAPKIEDSYFESNDYAIWANFSDVKITDSEIVKSTILDLYLENDAYITSLNTTFNDYAVHFDDALSVLEVQWYLHILVINATGPVPSADVTVSDNPNGTWGDTFVADAQGRVLWIVVTEYIRDLSTWVYYTPHNITASKGSEIGYAEPFMDISKLVIVNISPGPPAPLPPLPPVDLTITLLGSDLELTWSASPDDGGGANDVEGYVVYRANSIYGPYVNVSFIPAGLPTYSWIDSGKGDGNWNNYFYIVRAKDLDGLEDGNENKVGKLVSYLVEGWNMVSVPLVQSNTLREEVLQTLGTNYATVQGYHAGKSRPWLHWHRWKPNYFNDVIEIDNKRGYYIDMIVADHLVTVGKVSPVDQISLKSGWNLVGYPCLTDKLRDDALSSISGKYNMVERFDTNKDKEVRLGPGDYMQPGLGYWIHATQNCIWTITN
jgi:parallel beta-helix repeat protein